MMSTSVESLRAGRSELVGIARQQLRKRWAQMLLGIGALLALLAVDLLAPWPLKLVVDTVLLDRPLPEKLAWSAPLFAHGDVLALGVLAAVIAGFAILTGVFAYAQTFITARIGYEITHAVRSALFTRLSQLSLAFHARTRSGELLTRVGADTTLIRDVFADWIVKAVADTALIVGILIVMILMSWQLGALVACVLPLLFIALRRITRAIRNTARVQRKQDGDLTSRLNESLSSILLIQAFGREAHEQRRFEAESALSRDAGIRNARASALVSRAVGLIAALATAATVMLGGLFVVRGTLTPGDLLVFLAYVAALFKPVRDLGKLVSKFARARVSADRLAELLAIKPAVRELPNAVDAAKSRGALNFAGVCFGYDDGRRILDGLDLAIRAGEHLAIIGASGAGKSTLLRLALRLDDPQAGEIRLDDTPLPHLTLSSLRREVGVVLQDTALLGATIAENIAFGDPNAMPAQIEAAARLAGVHEFIASLPQGYATPLGERGATLSGGQRQRICIARTLVRDPAVLILDEPTSAVDPEMAAWIERTITAHRRGRTTVVMGHQFTSFAAFDRVLEVRGGAIQDVTARVRAPNPRALPGQVAWLKPTLLLYCQHSVGIGHLTRSFALAQALTREFHVVFLNGGPVPEGVPVPRDIEIIDLPPLGLEAGHQLVARNSRGDVPSIQRERRTQILATFARVQPDVVFMELFPFGRKKFAFELLPLLKAARRSAQRPIVVSSLRDILVAARRDQQHHDDRASWLCRRYFDAVLVHADERLARLDDTFRPRRALTVPVIYTGFAVPERGSARGRWSAPRGRSILVSAGGGQVGYPLLRTALDAYDLLASSGRPSLNLITGPFLPEGQFADLAARVEGRTDVVLERVVPDLVARMREASVSVSQCGYNTAMDIVAAGVPALVVPFAADGEDEQTNRARRMQELGLLRMFEASSLDAPRFARAIEATLEFRPSVSALNLDGARCTARELYRLWSERHMPHSQTGTA